MTKEEFFKGIEEHRKRLNELREKIRKDIEESKKRKREEESSETEIPE